MYVGYLMLSPLLQKNSSGTFRFIAEGVREFIFFLDGTSSEGIVVAQFTYYDIAV